MNNAHQRHLDRDRLVSLLEAAGTRWDQVRDCRPLTGGTFNTAYRIRLADGRGLVLKVSPEPSAPILRYEQEIMRTEALYYRLAGRCDVPIPQVVHAGFDSDVLDGDFLVMSECPGTGWNTLKERITPAGNAALRSDLGRMVAGLHTITGTGFGYPAQTLAPLAPSWRMAFLLMINAVLTDAERFEVALPRPTDAIREIAVAAAGVLDEVHTPVLVHFDLWDGNILLDVGGRRPRIGGLIDAERALWGDPAADFVSLALLGDIQDDEAFLSGYRRAGGQVTFDAPTLWRLALYRSYLYLIMLVEVVPRGFNDASRAPLMREVTARLLTELDGLAAARW